METIVFGSDHAGYLLKETLKEYLGDHGYIVKDVGAFSKERCDYPDFASTLAKAVSKGAFQRGILICKSGIGNSIVANRYPRVRAALCYNVKAARLSRQHNDSNILVLGSGFVSRATAQRIVSVWLRTDFEGGRHKRRLDKISRIEKQLGADYEKHS